MLLTHKLTLKLELNRLSSAISSSLPETPKKKYCKKSHEVLQFSIHTHFHGTLNLKTYSIHTLLKYTILLTTDFWFSATKVSGTIWPYKMIIFAITFAKGQVFSFTCHKTGKQKCDPSTHVLQLLIVWMQETTDGQEKR